MSTTTKAPIVTRQFSITKTENQGDLFKQLNNNQNDISRFLKSIQNCPFIFGNIAKSVTTGETRFAMTGGTLYEFNHGLGRVWTGWFPIYNNAGGVAATFSQRSYSDPALEKKSIQIYASQTCIASFWVF